MAWPWGARAAAGPVTPLEGRLPDGLRRLVAATELPPPAIGLFVCPVDASRPVAALNEEQAFTLASTAKIVTALAALDLLGPAFRWRTHAFVTAPIEFGRTPGDLLIVGGGDPRLSTPELRELLRRLHAQGLREVGGDIVIDRSAFLLSEHDHAGTPDPAPHRPHHVRPDALTVDAGVLRVTVQPQRGRRAQLVADPPLPELPLVDKTAGGGCHASLHWAESRGQSQLWLEGSWSASCGPRVLNVVPPSHADFMRQAIAGLWAEVGGLLRGRVRLGDLAAAQQGRTRLPVIGPRGDALMPLATHLSPPLPEVVRDINKTSDNVGARHLLLSLARGFPAQAATLARARDRVHEWLQGQGLPPGDIELDNGSGLSRAERGKPRAMVHLLMRAWWARDARSFIDSLPVAGVDGTLAHRLQGGWAAGQAFLKTGSLLDTRALAGYVRGRTGRIYALAVMVNHPQAGRTTATLDAIVEWLAAHG